MAFSPRSAALLAEISGGATEPAGMQPPTIGAAGSSIEEPITVLPDDGKVKEQKRLESEIQDRLRLLAALTNPTGMPPQAMRTPVPKRLFGQMGTPDSLDSIEVGRLDGIEEPSGVGAARAVSPPPGIGKDKDADEEGDEWRRKEEGEDKAPISKVVHKTSKAKPNTCDSCLSFAGKDVHQADED